MRRLARRTGSAAGRKPAPAPARRRPREPPASMRASQLAEKAHEPELVELAAQREEHGKPDEGRQHVALLWRCRRASMTPVAEQHARGPRKATAGRVEAESSPAVPQSATMPTNDEEHQSFVARERPERGERLAGRGAAPRAWTCHFGRDQTDRAERRHAAIAQQRRHGRRRAATSRTRSRRRAGARSRRPSGLAAIAVSQSADDRLEARHSRKHQERSEPLAVLVAPAARPRLRPARTRADTSRRSAPCCWGTRAR